MKDLGRNISCVTRRGPVDHTGYTVGIDFVWVSYVKKYQVCSRRARVWAKLSLQESAKLIHMVLTVLCARSSCREAVAREKRSKKQNDRIGHLVNLIKFWSIWFKDGCLQQGAASGCNRHREQNNVYIKLFRVRVGDSTFWHLSEFFDTPWHYPRRSAKNGHQNGHKNCRFERSSLKGSDGLSG